VAEKHHDPEIVPGNQLFVAAVALADSFATRLGFNVALGTPRPGQEEIEKFFGLEDEDAVAKFLEVCLRWVRMMSEILELPVTPPTSRV
jgi:hypothetical protein